MLDLYTDLSLAVPKAASFILSCHRAVFIITGIFFGFSVIYKDRICSQRVAASLNCAAALVLFIIIFAYSALVIMPLFD